MSVAFGTLNFIWLFEFLLSFHNFSDRIQMVSLLLIIKVVMIVCSTKFDIFLEDSSIEISDNIGFEVTKSVLN